MAIDWIVVGAGFTGATFAERMASAGKRVRISRAPAAHSGATLSTIAMSAASSSIVTARISFIPTARLFGPIFRILLNGVRTSIAFSAS